MAIVLLVHANSEERGRFVEVLRRAGLRSEAVGTSRAAMDYMDRRAPDIAIVAGERCDEGSLMLIQRLRAHAMAQDMPILAICDDPAVTKRLATLAAGADDCLSAMASDEQLLLRVQNLLNRRDNLPSLAPQGFARRILVVDDSPTYAHALIEELRIDGHDVAFAENAGDCIAFLDRHRADLVILDVFLPDTNGIDVCRRIKTSQHTATIPVLILTGRERSAVRDAATSALADEFAVKSRDFAAIRLKVRGLLARPPSRTTSATRLPAVEQEPRGNATSLDLFDHIVRGTGLSELLARSTVESICRKLDLEPRALTPSDVPRVVDALSRSLQLFLPAPEARERLAALLTLGT